MKLYLNTTSPFARLVRATALETGRDDLDLIAVDPWSDQAELLAVNPLGRIPVLEDGGVILTESLLILRHLTRGNDALRADDVGTMAELGIAYGLMELAFAHTIHAKHCGDAGAVLQERRQSGLARGLQVMEQAVARDARWSMSRLCLGIALDYIRFRAVTGIGAERYPALTAFMAAHEDRPAIRQTGFA